MFYLEEGALGLATGGDFARMLFGQGRHLLIMCARDAVSKSRALSLVQRANPFSPNNRGLSDCHATALICAVIIRSSTPKHTGVKSQENADSKASKTWDGANI